MSSVRRVSSGSTLQIKTGVISGIGPIGPTGPTGPAGPSGEIGPKGDQGEIGYVDSSCTVAYKSGNQTLSASSSTIVIFNSVEADELAAVTSATTFTPYDGNYYLGVWIEVSNTGGSIAGLRTVEIVAGGRVVAAESKRMTSLDTVTHLNVATGVRVDGVDTIQVRVSSTDTVSCVISDGRIWISPHGPGVRGPIGPYGPEGQPGPRGLTGPIGPAGTPVDFATFADLATKGA